MLTVLKVSSLACECAFYTPELKAKQGPHGIEFWRSSNVEMKYTNGMSWKSRWEKWGYLSSYNVSSQSYGH